MACGEMIVLVCSPRTRLHESSTTSERNGFACKGNGLAGVDLLLLLAMDPGPDLSVNAFGVGSASERSYLQSTFLCAHLEHGEESASQCALALMHARHDRFLVRGECLAFIRQ
jgi:hypothetical protein